MSEQQKKNTGYDKDRKDSNKKTKLNNKNKLGLLICKSKCDFNIREEY